MVETLAQRCQAGDLAAFDELFAHYEARLYRLALTILGNEKDAEDAVQDTFLRVFERIGRYRHDAALTTWLTAIAVNVCRDRLRRARVRRAFSLDWLRGLAGDHNVDEQATDNDRRQSLWAAVNALDDTLRLPIILHYGQGLPCDQVAQVLGLPVSRVYSRLNTARAALRQALQPAAEPAPPPLLHSRPLR
jgi:RNA polymerase sigma-70 factor (ECF subfamily)